MIYQIFLIQTTLINLVLLESDTLDFRPRVTPFGTESGKSPFDYDSRDFSVTGSTSPLIPKDSGSVLSYDYYLGRMDRIILTPGCS